MTGTEKTARPITGQARPRTRRQTRCWDTTQMGTDGNTHKVLGKNGAPLVLSVFGSEAGTVRKRVSQLIVLRAQSGELVFGAVKDPDRVTAPFNGADFARANGGQVDFNGCACCTSTGRRCKRTDKRDCGGHASHTTHSTGGGDPKTARWVRWQDRFLFRSVLFGLCRRLTHSSILIFALKGLTASNLISVR